MEVLFVVSFMSAVTSAVIAESKGRSGGAWFILGCLLGVFAIIMVACMPRLAEEADGV